MWVLIITLWSIANTQIIIEHEFVDENACVAWADKNIPKILQPDIEGSYACVEMPTPSTFGIEKKP